MAKKKRGRPKRRDAQLGPTPETAAKVERDVLLALVDAGVLTLEQEQNALLQSVALLGLLVFVLAIAAFACALSTPRLARLASDALASRLALGRGRCSGRCRDWLAPAAQHHERDRSDRATSAGSIASDRAGWRSLQRSPWPHGLYDLSRRSHRCQCRSTW